MNNNAQPLRDYLKLFEALTSGDLDRLGLYFDAGARFKDPFNDVRGIDEIKRVFKNMFEVCIDPRFRVTAWALRGNIAFVQWQFTYSLKQNNGGLDAIEGVSIIQFNAEGLVTEHVDYWDPAEHIYTRLPVVGGLIRWLRSKFSA